ncbi:hypothetical protein QY97_01602 [Bacillus thermotolerans]|uniref:Uncharacterized protein n=1 Tax=Bacillus thermotolerans TaxID=1221996 RepID=A0A0F5HQX7_BACTR|nr:hypothetical protein QY97_01602 [Bacillus thermotolerans]KKB40484.1 hypothetical protein QY95_01479 [Bacillus thermotolerans]
MPDRIPPVNRPLKPQSFGGRFLFMESFVPRDRWYFLKEK